MTAFVVIMQKHPEWSLLDICIENVGELIRINFGKEVIYELATGGFEDILHPTLDDKINSFHKAIESLAVVYKSEDSQEEEHVFEKKLLSWTIRFRFWMFVVSF
ncbi:unnamed protein product [Lathyrus sativus]|nr:unnamed protein product [Lathyrus sativus]